MRRRAPGVVAVAVVLGAAAVGGALGGTAGAAVASGLAPVGAGAFGGLVPFALPGSPVPGLPPLPAGAVTPVVSVGSESPAEVQARLRSASAFRGESPAQALLTAARVFPAAINAPVWRGPVLPAGARVERYVDSSTAFVSVPGAGHGGLLQSTTPLLGSTPAGATAPVDLSLVAHGGGFAPRSAAVALEIPGSTGTPVVFPGGSLAVRLPTVGGPVAAVLSHDRAFYGAVSTDEDISVAAAPQGLELDAFLRSPAASTTVPLAFALPAGAALHLVGAGESRPPGSVAIEQAGKTIGLVMPASGLDARGRPVGVSYSLADASTLVMHVLLPSPVSWPATLDPVVDVYPNGDTPGTGCWRDWGFATNTATFAGIANLAPTAQSAMFISANPNTTYQAGAFGVCYRLPRPNSYIYGATLFNSSLQYTAGVPANPPTVQSLNGLFDPMTGFYALGNWVDNMGQAGAQGLAARQQGLNFATVTSYCATPCAPPSSALHDGTYAFFEIAWPSQRFEGASYPYVAIGNASTLSSDNYPPVIAPDGPASHSANLAAWTSTLTDRVTITAADVGLGLKGVSLSGPGITDQGIGSGLTVNNSCTGSTGSQCPASTPAGCTLTPGTGAQLCSIPQGLSIFYKTTASTPDGINVLTETATDIVGNQTQQTFQVKIDTTPPDVALGGSLAVADGSTLTQPSYQLQIDAVGGDAEAPGSPVTSILVKEDGTTVAQSPPQTNLADNAPLSYSYNYNAAADTAGQHAFTVTATDQVGNPFTDSITVNVLHVPSLGTAVSSLSTAIATLTGANGGDQAGQSVANLGDLQGTGQDDFAVGAPGAANNLLRLASGSVYIVSASQLASGAFSLANPSSYLFRIDGPAIASQCGAAVASLGNFDGSGQTSLAIGCPDNGLGLGLLLNPKVYLLFGKDFQAGAPQTIDLSAVGAQGFEIDGPVTNQLPTLLGGLLGTATPKIFGQVLAGESQGTFALSGDLVGQDQTDLVIGSPTESNNGNANSGSAYVIFGKSDTVPISTTVLASAGYRIDGAHAGDLLGSAAAVAGNVDASGDSGIVLGAPGESDNSLTGNGDAYVLFPRALANNQPNTATVQLSALAGQGYAIQGASSGQQLGSSVAGLGDVNSDGQDDVALGANDGAYVVYGTANTTTINLASPPTSYGFHLSAPANSGGASGRLSTTSVASAGDLQGGGFNSLIVGFPTPASGPPTTYVVYGNEAPGDLSLTTMGAQQGQALTGAAASTAGTAPAEVDGTNASPDPGVLVGAPGASDAGGTSGSVYMLRASQLTQGGANSPYATATGGTCSAPNAVYRPNKVPFPFHFCDTAGHAALPTVRFTALSHHDGKPFAKGRAIQTNRLAMNPNAIGQRSWTFTDSFGNPIATVLEGATMKGRISVTVSATDPAAPLHTPVTTMVALPTGVSPTLPTNLGLFSIQGFACSSAPNMVLVAYNGPLVAGVDTGIRAFLPLAAIPKLDQPFISQVHNPKATSGYGPVCQGGDARADHGLAAATAHHPTFAAYPAPIDRYQDTVNVPLDVQNTQGGTCPTPPGPTGPCGTPYANYSRPNYGSFVYLEQATSEVTPGGGEVIGIVRDGQGYSRLDEISYLDTNIPCGKLPETQWLLGRFNIGGHKVYGWLPTLIAPTGGTPSNPTAQAPIGTGTPIQQPRGTTGACATPPAS